MEENLTTSQAPISEPSEEGSNIGRLENELEELKKKAQAGDPFEPMPVSQNPNGGGSALLKFGFLLFGLAVLLAGIYIVKSLSGKIGPIKLNLKKTTQATSTPTPSETPNIFAAWKKYSDPSGVYTFSYPTDYSASDYKEDGNPGVLVSKNEGFGAQYEKDYVRVKSLYLKGQNIEAKSKIAQLRLLAISLQREKNTVSDVSEVKVGGRVGYKYQIVSSSGITAEDVVVQVGRDLARVEIEYQFVKPVEGKYEDSVGKILSSFTFSDTPVAVTTSPSPSALPNTGFFATSEPESATGGSSFGDINR